MTKKVQLRPTRGVSVKDFSVVMNCLLRESYVFSLPMKTTMKAQINTLLTSCLQTYLRKYGQNPICGISCMRESNGKLPKSFARAVGHHKGKQISNL